MNKLLMPPTVNGLLTNVPLHDGDDGQLGIVDASTKDRLGYGQALLNTAKEVRGSCLCE